MMVLESEGMAPKRYGVGEVIFFRKGAHAKWHVEGYVRKIAFLRHTTPIGLGLAIRAVNGFKRYLRRAVARRDKLVRLCLRQAASRG